MPLGEERYRECVREHRSTFITRDDFVRIAARGFNAVRLPVPWYVFEGESGASPYLGCIEFVDNALEWAEEIDLKVVFALAISPGAPHSGSGNAPDNADCHVDREKILDVVYQLSKRYASRAGFFGMELADAPVLQVRRGLRLTDGLPVHRLRNYYREAYERVRGAAGDDVVVIMPDAGVPKGWGRFMAQRHYRNVWLDCQLDRSSAPLDVSGPAGVRRLVSAHERYLKDARHADMPVMVGKWSSSLPVSDSQMTPEGRIALERVYTSEQVRTYEKCPAWFFNTWKTSGKLAAWDARVALATFERALIV